MAAVTGHYVLLSHRRHYTDLQRDCKVISRRFPYIVPILYLNGTVHLYTYTSTVTEHVKKQEKYHKNFDKRSF